MCDWKNAITVLADRHGIASLLYLPDYIIFNNNKLPIYYNKTDTLIES